MARTILRAEIASIARECSPRKSLEALPMPEPDSAPATLDALRELYSRPYGVIEQAMPHKYCLIFRGSRWLIRLMIRAMIGEMEALLLAYPPSLNAQQAALLAADAISRPESAEAIIEQALASSNPLQQIDGSLRKIDWNRNLWARDAGLDRTTLYRWFTTGRASDDSRDRLVRALRKRLAEVRR
jgi:hypothetical protein